jgi:uncharacterized membrane protein
MTKTRMEAFSDAVIAIIMTIMVLELRAPIGSDWHNLKDLLPILLSYAISFLNLGIYWGNHHHLVHTIKEVRGGILWANLHLLFWLSFMPFATAWMGENDFSRNTVVLYALLANACGIAYYIFLIVIRNCNPGNPVLSEVLRKQKRKGLISLMLYTTAAALAFINSAIACVLIALVAFAWLMPDRNIEKNL